MHVNGCYGCETLLECPRHRPLSDAERREVKPGGCVGDWSGSVVLCKTHGRPLAQCPAYTTHSG
jgi:hypothetical protein